MVCVSFHPSRAALAAVKRKKERCASGIMPAALEDEWAVVVTSRGRLTWVPASAGMEALKCLFKGNPLDPLRASIRRCE